MATVKPYRSIFRSGLFEDDVALVTGGGSGIGRCIAHELASLGAMVIIAGRKLDKLEATAKEIRSLGLKVDIAQFDIRDLERVRVVLKDIVNKYGKITCLVNNAGGQFLSHAESISPKGWRTVVDMNLNGTWNMCYACYHAWMGEHGGRIVNILADMINGMPSISHTGAARAGVGNLTKSLCREWGPTAGIRVNAVAPGTIVSSGMRNYSEEHQRQMKAWGWQNPSGRFGTVDEVSSAVVYLLSPAASYINGVTLSITGGSLGESGPLNRFQKDSRISPYDGGLASDAGEHADKLLREYQKIGKDKSKL